MRPVECGSGAVYRKISKNWAGPAVALAKFAMRSTIIDVSTQGGGGGPRRNALRVPYHHYLSRDRSGSMKHSGREAAGRTYPESWLVFRD